MYCYELADGYPSPKVLLWDLWWGEESPNSIE